MSDFDYLHDRLDELSKIQRLRRLTPRSLHATTLQTADGRSFHNFGSNDYLGLASERTETTGRGATASALVCGWTDSHQQLADEIAKLEATESAVVFPSGYAACSGTIATLAEEGDLILSDERNHASLIDGCRLSRAKRVVYPHRQCEYIEDVLKQRRLSFQRVWIVTDGVFSMDGHLAPLVELTELADRYDANLIVDEAHGTGVMGASGSGVCEELHVKQRVPIRIGTLSKAVGAQGGFVAGPRVVIDYLINRCRTLIFSTALAPASVAAARAGLESIRQQPKRREAVRRLARQVRTALELDSAAVECEVPIVPWIVGADRDAIDWQARLSEAGFYVPAIRPPTVAEGSARLRISLSAIHSPDVVDRLVQVLRPG